MCSLWRKPKVAVLFFLSLKVSGRDDLVSVVFYQEVNFESPKKINKNIMRI